MSRSALATRHVGDALQFGTHAACVAIYSALLARNGQRALRCVRWAAFAALVMRLESCMRGCCVQRGASRTEWGSR